jgi:predicted RNA-binding protein
MEQIRPENDVTLKEWAPIIEALGRGKQIFLLRKYEPSSSEFFLQPTYSFSSEDFKEDYRALVEESSRRKAAREAILKYYAECVEVVRLEDKKALERLSDYYLWASEHVLEYFFKKQSIPHIWLLRVFKLPTSFTIKASRAVIYQRLPEPLSTRGAVPVLMDEEFRSKVEQVRQVISAEPMALERLKRRITFLEKELEKKEQTIAQLTSQTRVKEPDHDHIKDVIHELGELKGEISEKEYPLDSGRLDVAWKRIRGGMPFAVFEVQIAGNSFQALAKLKHAWDMWNSTPFLVTTPEYEEKARQWVAGSFHEIRGKIRIINWVNIEALYEAEKRAREIRELIGIQYRS